jgi:hypothetical protein
MTRPGLEVGDVFRAYEPELPDPFEAAWSVVQRRAFRDIAQCRTAVLGGHVDACDQCGHQRISYNSCRNRHCPKCQAMAGADWMAARAEDLLPVEYYHVVFTIPEELGPIALQNPRVVYDLLFQAAAATLIEIAANPQHLGARIGFHAVLHTWGQTLQHHPHLHCVVPGGGLSADGQRWISCRPGFFLPVRILSRVFRGKFLSKLRQAFDQGRLSFHGELSSLADPGTFQKRLSASARTDWMVYAKPPFGGPEAVLKYLARYTHRVAISNRRLISLDDGEVGFQYKDYARKARSKIMRLTIFEFIRRFLLHILPSGFVRIRHFGFLCNRFRRQKVALCRQLLEAAKTPESEFLNRPPADKGEPERLFGTATCPCCGKGRMVIIRALPPMPRTLGGSNRFAEPGLVVDSS